MSSCYVDAVILIDKLGCFGFSVHKILIKNLLKGRKNYYSKLQLLEEANNIWSSNLLSRLAKYEANGRNGAPKRARTSNHPVRSRVLYPIELSVRIKKIKDRIAYWEDFSQMAFITIDGILLKLVPYGERA